MNSMRPSRANASLAAVLVILVVIAGVIYLFWQTTLVQEGLKISTSEPDQPTATTASSETPTQDAKSNTLEGETTLSIESKTETKEPVPKE